MKRPRRAVHGILLLDKPAGCTSNQALQRAKRIFQAEKAGHTGSLDPLATGLLPICFGEATKLSGYLLDADKRYVVRAKLGEKTNTADAEGEVLSRSDAGRVQRADLAAQIPKFTGALKQIPPMVSALKHQGERLYDLARRGEEVPREPRDIVIRRLELLAFEPPFFELDVSCTKGTYIRALVEDLAGALGQCAHVTVLRRMELSPFTNPQMVTLDVLEQTAEQGVQALDGLLLPLTSALAHRPQLVVNADQQRRLKQGQAVQVTASEPVGDVVVLSETGVLLGIGLLDVSGQLTPRRWMINTT
ncbi:MAG: tRNA pseudouridine(55) synthase TruB [Pseudomonadota bacterium]